MSKDNPNCPRCRDTGYVYRTRPGASHPQRCPECPSPDEPPTIYVPAAVERPPQRVVCAANRNLLNGRIICGARHYDNIMHDQINASEGREGWLGSEQGFIDQFGTFLTREEAHAIATNNGQIRRRCGGDATKLFSENLY